MWSRQESNLYLEFRKRLFYPLNYGTGFFKTGSKSIHSDPEEKTKAA
jgi:hypothetical protein